uniref:Neurobeachin n=1 Tax=Astyanax mexicanus TaxID=7994 RepID=A0A8B9GVI1_ASTMX
PEKDNRAHPPPGSAAGEVMVSGAGSVVLPAGVINPSVPIRNIKMKFAVLIGLIQVGEVSNRDIVETVLNLVSRSLYLRNSWKKKTKNMCFYFIYINKRCCGCCCAALL